MSKGVVCGSTLYRWCRCCEDMFWQMAGLRIRNTTDEGGCEIRRDGIPFNVTIIDFPTVASISDIFRICLFTICLTK